MDKSSKSAMASITTRSTDKSAGSHEDLASVPVLKAGFLWRDGEILSGMRAKRYYKLQGKVLHEMSDSKPGASVLYSLNVYGCTVRIVKDAGSGGGLVSAAESIGKSFTSKLAIDSADKSYAIHIYDESKQRDIVLRAASQKECQSWFDVLIVECGTALTYFYDLGKMIGSGAYGQVYEAKRKADGKTCAAKAVSKLTAARKELQYLARETAIMKKLDHPHCVETLDIFDSDGKIWFVMELLKGGELFDIVSEMHHFTEAQAVEVARQIVSGIAYLHANKIVHRDIKPENVLCVNRTFPLQCKITDFGLSNFLPDTPDTSLALKSYVGTPNYVAPEVMLQRPYGPAVDIFAVGVVLYILLCGRFPFYGERDDEYLARCRRGPKFLDKYWAGVSEDAKDLIVKMTAYDPNERPSAEEVLEHSWFDKLDDPDFATKSAAIATKTMHSTARRRANELDALK
ncbi:putative myosin light chain kinase [Porphyridium purpureum]|uniref:Putative myosin light chain kinase n=1 Tax=Porphyridium purpureum TaxID=35688 RepID=A0A5J4Z0E6_PORPP|nr:putative myosin light chain kinase [Porphyridium purpureum]|eukprot:POR8738..scf208_2